MKYYAYFLILFLVAVSAHSAETIHEEASMKANGRLTVSNIAGSVEIQGWSRKQIEVTGELGDGSILQFEVDDDSATVKVEVENQKKKKRNWDTEATDLVIHVPHSTRVSATTVSADLTVAEITGIQRLQTVSGDLKTDVTEAEAVIKTVSGEIDIRGNRSRSQLTIATVSGDVDVVDVAGEVSAKSVSGDVVLHASELKRLELGTVSGDVECSGELETGGRIDAESVSGDIELKLASLDNTEYFLESFSGDIHPILNHKSARTSQYAPGSKLELTAGDGDSMIRVETMSGDIDITETGKSR